MPVSLPTLLKFGSTAYGMYQDAKSVAKSVRNTLRFGQKVVGFARRHVPHGQRHLAWA